MSISAIQVGTGTAITTALAGAVAAPFTEGVTAIGAISAVPIAYTGGCPGGMTELYLENN